MIPLLPNRLRDGDNIEVDAINDDLRALARDIELERQRRYVRSTCVFDLTGMTSADDVSLRKFYVRRFGVDNSLEIEGVELVIYTTVAVTWTVACSDSSFPDLTLLTVVDAAAATENYATTDRAVQVSSDAADLTFTLSASGASTITGGQLIVHFRCDRGNQGSDLSGYAPTLIDATTSTAVATLNDEITAANAAYLRLNDCNLDLRVECFVTRALPANTSRVWRTQGGERTKGALLGYVIDQASGAANKINFTVDAETLTVNGAGANTEAVDELDLTGSAGADPTNSADDTVITIANPAGSATAGLVYALVFWT